MNEKSPGVARHVAVLECWLKERREEAALIGSPAISLARDEALDAAIRALRPSAKVEGDVYHIEYVDTDHVRLTPALSTPAAAPAPVDGMVLAQLRQELAEDKGWDCTEYEKGRIAEKERCVSLLAAAPTSAPTPDRATPGEQDAKVWPPKSSLPSWGECKLRVDNSDFISARLAEGGYGAEPGIHLATDLHRFIYEYDDADPYKSAWFMHRLELALTQPIASSEAAPDHIADAGKMVAAHGEQGDIRDRVIAWTDGATAWLTRYGLALGPGTRALIDADELTAALAKPDGPRMGGVE